VIKYYFEKETLWIGVLGTVQMGGQLNGAFWAHRLPGSFECQKKGKGGRTNANFLNFNGIRDLPMILKN